jgi:hypothetical protein
MRLLPFFAAMSVAVLALDKPAQAQNYPWCAYYSGGRGGGENCGFVTFQQCLATVSGIGGFCEPNTQFQPPPGPRPTARLPRPNLY